MFSPKLNRRLTYECRCDERLNVTDEGSIRRIDASTQCIRQGTFYRFLLQNKKMRVEEKNCHVKSMMSRKPMEV